MKDQVPREVTKAFLDIVENQIRDNTPPETRETLDRLQRLGESREEAVRLIACAVASEVFHILKYSEEFNKERFIKNIHQLPKLPRELTKFSAIPLHIQFPAASK